MNVLGISAYYHDSSACLVRDGEVVAASQEERFNREKYSADFPIQAINDCLQQGGITAYDLDHVAFYEKPYLKFERTILSQLAGFPLTARHFLETMPNWLKDRLAVPLTIREELSYKGPISYVPHHLAHAASAFFVSPFEEAAIITIDGVGEQATTAWGVARGSAIEMRQELRYPHSLGLLYSIVTAYLGFRVFSGEGKVMALAEFGEPAYLDRFRQILDVREDGSFRLDERYFNFNRGATMYGRRFLELFGPARAEGAPIERRHQDVAASLQRAVEEAILKIAHHVQRETGLADLCLAGGVFLNVTTNSRLQRETRFQRIFIQPAAGDNGTALGAAAYVSHALLGQPRRTVMRNAYLGPSFGANRIRRLLQQEGVAFRELSGEALAAFAARCVAEDKIVGWFQGRMEFGPRALGARSILANPARPDMKDLLNSRVKHRESFRPFGVSVLREDVGEFFDWSIDSPYMLHVAKVRPEKAALIPAAVHVNGTSRLQTVTREENGLYYDAIREFKRLTGIPMVINTSFNDNDEPIVCTPEEAYRCFRKTGIDVLVIGDFVVEKGGGAR